MIPGISEPAAGYNMIVLMDNVIASISTKPTSMQVAKDGEWECSLKWQLDKFPSSLPTFLRDAYQSLGAELFFDQPDGVFVLGIEFRDRLKTPTEFEFVQAIHNVARQFPSFSEVLTHLNRNIVGTDTLLKDDPDIIRVGVVDHWFSVGPCEIWRKGEAKSISLESIQRRLDQHPLVNENSLNYQGMSFVFNIDAILPSLCHWIKSPCSVYDSQTWKVDTKKIAHFLHSWAGFKIA